MGAQGAGRGEEGGGGGVGCRGGTGRERNYRCSYPHPLSWHPQMRCRGQITVSFVLSFGRILSFVISLVRTISSWERPGRRAKGELATCLARTADGKPVLKSAPP